MLKNSPPTFKDSAFYSRGHATTYMPCNPIPRTWLWIFCPQYEGNKHHKPPFPFPFREFLVCGMIGGASHVHCPLVLARLLVSKKVYRRRSRSSLSRKSATTANIANRPSHSLLCLFYTSILSFLHILVQLDEFVNCVDDVQRMQKRPCLDNSSLPSYNVNSSDTINKTFISLSIISDSS